MFLFFVLFPILVFADDSLEKFLINKNVLVPEGYDYYSSTPYEQYQVFEKGIINELEQDTALVSIGRKGKKVRIDDIRLNFEGIKNPPVISVNDSVFIKLGTKFFEGTAVMEGNKLSGRIHEYNGLDKKIPRSGYSAESMMANVSINDGLRGNCLEKNLIRENRWSMKPSKLPQYDQGPEEICYAFVGMQLIDFYNLYHGGNKDFFDINRPFLGSAIYLALRAREFDPDFDPDKDRENFGLGLSTNIISAAEKYGYCHDDVLERSIRKFIKSESLKLTTQEFYFLTLYFLNTFKMGVKETSKETGKTPQKVMEKIIKNIKKSETRKFYDKIWAGYSKSQYAEISPIKIENINKEAIEKLFSKYSLMGDYVGFLENVFKDCNIPGNFTKFKLGELTTIVLKNTQTDEDVMNIISNELGKKNATGMAIGYCGKVLEEGSGWEGFPTKNRSKPGDCGQHASILIGQRMRGGKCQYLLRNTRGFKGCESGVKYSGDWECQFDGPGKESGIWVDAKKLASAIFDLDYFNAPPTATENSKLKGQKMKFNNMMKMLRK